MNTTPTTENAAAWFNARTVTDHLDVVDRVAVSIVDTRTVKGSAVRFYNADDEEFMTLKSDDVSTRFEPLFGESLAGVRHAEDGRLYAILRDGDSALFRERSRLAALNTATTTRSPSLCEGLRRTKGEKDHDRN